MLSSIEPPTSNSFIRSYYENNKYNGFCGIVIRGDSHIVRGYRRILYNQAIIQDPKKPIQTKWKENFERILRTRNGTFHRNHIGLLVEDLGSLLQNIQGLCFRQSTFTKEMRLEEFMIRFLFSLIIREELVVCRLVCCWLNNLRIIACAVRLVRTTNTLRDKETYTRYWSSFGIKRWF